MERVKSLGDKRSVFIEYLREGGVILVSHSFSDIERSN